jgi:hypothetical protein
MLVSAPELPHNTENVRLSGETGGGWSTTKRRFCEGFRIPIHEDGFTLRDVPSASQRPFPDLQRKKDARPTSNQQKRRVRSEQHASYVCVT